MIPLRRFNESGLAAMGEALDRLDLGEDVDIQTLLVDPALTETLSGIPTVEIKPFANRREAGEFFHHLLKPFEPQIGDIERDRGLWAWLALVWIDVLAPVDPSTGRRTMKDRARWIPVVDDYRKYYRHLLAGPYRIYRAHHEDVDRAMAVLATPVQSPGEVVEQFASRQEIITNPNLMSAITALYYNPATRSLKRGAGGKGGGSSRRLADVLLQFDMTWDVYGMTRDEVINLLPQEFAKFKPA
jgi:hypothetical protein